MQQHTNSGVRSCGDKRTWHMNGPCTTTQWTFLLQCNTKRLLNITLKASNHIWSFWDSSRCLSCVCLARFYILAYGFVNVSYTGICIPRNAAQLIYGIWCPIITFQRQFATRNVLGTWNLSTLKIFLHDSLADPPSLTKNLATRLKFLTTISGMRLNSLATHWFSLKDLVFLLSLDTRIPKIILYSKRS